jgi:hypothetical protein
MSEHLRPSASLVRALIEQDQLSLWSIRGRIGRLDPRDIEYVMAVEMAERLVAEIDGFRQFLARGNY